MNGLTMGSLFDGIGGFPLAAIRSGITPVWASEIEAFPIEVTKQRFPSMIHVGDITKLNGAELPPVELCDVTHMDHAWEAPLRFSTKACLSSRDT